MRYKASRAGPAPCGSVASPHLSRFRERRLLRRPATLPSCAAQHLSGSGKLHSYGVQSPGRAERSMTSSGTPAGRRKACTLQSSASSACTLVQRAQRRGHLEGQHALRAGQVGDHLQAALLQQRAQQQLGHRACAAQQAAWAAGLGAPAHTELEDPMGGQRCDWTVGWLSAAALDASMDGTRHVPRL